MSLHLAESFLFISYLNATVQFIQDLVNNIWNHFVLQKF